MRIRRWSDPIVSSHILLFVNCCLYSISGYWLLTIFLFCNVVLSLMYHRYAEENEAWGNGDFIFSHLTLICIFIHLLNYCDWLETLICAVWLILSLWVKDYYFQSYRFFHTLWHVMVFLGNLIVWHFLPLTEKLIF